MTNEDHSTSGGKSFFSNHRSQIIVLGMIGFTVAAIALICPAFWKDYRIPILLIASGFGMPALFSLWNYWVEYGWEVGIAPGLTFVLMGIFIWLFGYEAGSLWADAVSNLFWTNLLVLAIWLILVLFAFRSRSKKENAQQDYRKGEVWRDYRWIIAPAVIILLFLFDTSWAQSTLSILSLKKSDIKPIPAGAFQIHAEYPLQIPFDDAESSEIHLWATGALNCMDLEISADGLLFAFKPQSEEPLVWNDILAFKLSKSSNAVTLLVTADERPTTGSRFVELTLKSGGNKLDTSKWAIRIESKQDSQIRGWKKNFLDAGSTIVSLITAVFVGVKQLEEEKKRQKIKQVEQVISKLETEAKENFSKTLQEHWDLTADWNEWDKTLQVQFRDKYASFVEKGLWDAIANKTLKEVKKGVYLLLQICERIFEDKESKPISIVKQLQKALENDARALLSMLKEYPESIGVAKQIASNFSSRLKNRTVFEYAIDFPNQIRFLRVELDFPDTESFPLQEQFTYHAKDHTPEEKLTAWLNAHELDCSPFADTDSPFFSFDKKLFIELATPRFAFPEFRFQNASFEFATSWDTGAALFEYCKLLQKNITFKDAAFFVLINPGMLENHEASHPQKLYLHALAEQWILTLSENPTLFYSLKGAQRDLTGRLLRWHDLSPSITANKITERLQGRREDQIAKVLPGKIRGWLEEMNATDLRLEEINALIALRPSPKQYTLFLISTIDLNPHVERQISPSLQEALGRQSDWLNVHNCGFVRFLLGSKNRQIVSDDSLVSQCNIRVRNSSKNKNVDFNQLFDTHGEEPDLVLARKAAGSPGKMVRLGQKLLLQHVEKYPPDEPLHIEDLLALA